MICNTAKFKVVWGFFHVLQLNAGIKDLNCHGEIYCEFEAVQTPSTPHQKVQQ